jgi:hypothetical protein
MAVVVEDAPLFVAIAIQDDPRQQMEPPREGCVSTGSVETQGSFVDTESTGSAHFWAGLKKVVWATNERARGSGLPTNSTYTLPPPTA